MTRSSFTIGSAQKDAERVYKVWREKFIVPLLIGTLILGALALVSVLQTSKNPFINGTYIVLLIAIAIITAFKFSYNIRIAAFLSCVYLISLVELINLGIEGDATFFFLGLIAFSTMFVSPKFGITALLLSMGTIIAAAFASLLGHLLPIAPNALYSEIGSWFSGGLMTFLFGVIVILGLQQLEKEYVSAQRQVALAVNDLREERNNLEAAVQDRTAQLRHINEVERAISTTLNLNEIASLVVTQIQKEFDFIHIGFYLLDATGQWAELKEAASETGAMMKEGKYRVNVHDKGPVAQTIRSKTGTILQDVAQIQQENSIFPYTRSLLVVPLISGNDIFGALELHSSHIRAFMPQDLDAYQNMANGIASAIANARLFQEAQQSIAEMKATQRQYIESAWNTLSSERIVRYALGDAELALNNPLEMPLVLRDQTIGQVLAAGIPDWTDEQKNLVQAITAQATLALENARLVESSQFAAVQEKLANEIISKIWASSTLDAILQTTVRELGRSLEASEVEIEISMEGPAHDN